MNSVSWFLYLVDISSGIGAFFSIIAFLCVVSAIVIVIVGGVMRDTDYGRRSGPEMDERRKRGIALQWKATWFAGPALLFMLLSFLIPSKDTLYMIGASQVGEQIVALQEVQDMGGEVGGLAKDTIALLREKIQSSLSETSK